MHDMVSYFVKILGLTYGIKLMHVVLKLSKLVELLGGAIAGLHTMTDEHFGIVVVEYMASGAVPIGKGNIASSPVTIFCSVGT